jgi:hypothetical protein
MEVVSDSSKRALSRFSNPKDPTYLRIVGQVRRCLLFKASERKELEILLKDLISSIDPKVDPGAVDAEDEQGRSTLHYATSSSNDVAVTILIHRGQANVLHQDALCQTPLHLAIKRAVELNPIRKEDQKPFEDVIIRLMENSEDISEADNARKTAWAFADDLAWIQNLKNNRDMFSGPSISDGRHHGPNPTANPGNVTDPEPATQNFEAASYDETFITNAEVIRDSFQILALTRTLSGETLVPKTVTMDRDAIVLFVSGTIEGHVKSSIY